jgi:hypothetical protein
VALAKIPALLVGRDYHKCLIRAAADIFVEVVVDDLDWRVPGAATQ